MAEFNYKPLVLIIDDNESVRASFSDYLEDVGFNTICASDGQSGIELFDKHNPNTVLLDLRMPGIDGLDVLAKMTSISRDIPVIVITGHGTYEDILVALRNGAWDYLQKPVENLDILKHTVVRALAYNNLRKENNQQFLDIQKSNQELSFAIKDAEKARADLEKAYHAKTEFLEKLSSELRIPALGIESMIEILLESGLDKSVRHYARVIQSNITSLCATINSLVDFSKIETKRLNLEKVNFNLQSIIDSTVNKVLLNSDNNKIGFSVSKDPDIPLFYIGDPWRIGQILSILLENAFMYTNDGQITLKISSVSISPGTAHLKFEISDTGLGIRSEALTSLFDAFNKKENAGLGLGLALARRLSEMMDGKIGAQSSLGAGSTFWFTLKLERQLSSMQTDETGIGQRSDVIASQIQGNLKVLIADRNEDSQIITGAFLQRIGCKHKTSSNGSQTLELLEEEDFDVLLLDQDLPGIGGFELVGIIRNSISAVKNHEIPIVLLSSKLNKAIREKSKSIKINSCIPRPFTFSQLTTSLKEAISPPE